MHLLAQQLVQMVQELAATDISTLPAPKFLGAFRRELILKGFAADVAEKIASKVKVNLPAGCLDDEALQAIAAAYATIVANTQSAFIAEGFVDPTSAVIEMAAGMTLSMS